ncbi:MAG: dCMP deaminase family protein [Candidatus Eisenbacteria bacterium]
MPWDEYFMKIAYLVAERSTCTRHHVGAVVVMSKRLLTTGYNGAPSGVRDCLELGCLRDERGITSGEKHEICRAIHAEQNAVIQAGLHGISINGATLYCTHTPCILCAKILVNARIRRVVACGRYPDEDAVRLLGEAGVEFCLLRRPALSISALD